MLKPPFRAPSIPYGSEDGSTYTRRNKFIQMKQVFVYSPGNMGRGARKFVPIRDIPRERLMNIDELSVIKDLTNPGRTVWLLT